MRNVIQYFDLIAKTVEFSAAASAELDLEQLDHARGTLDGVIHFADGSRLELTERIAIERSRPVKRDYRYQYVREGKAVFRYDNAPHHPGIATFPHHKHVGRKTLPSDEPTRSQVLDEVSALQAELEQAPAGKAKARWRRRRK